MIAHLRSLLRDVDSSLLEEWEALGDPTRRPAKAAARAAAAPVDPVAERALGNHPQAYSHIGLLRCAQLLDG